MNDDPSQTDSMKYLSWLQLLQLADSALPIGATAHSLGLETLTHQGLLTVAQLEMFFRDYLLETGTLEALYCRQSYVLAKQAVDQSSEDFVVAWLNLNRHLDALKTARESRNASTTLGRRFLQLAVDLEEQSLRRLALQSAKQANVGVHHCTAFGLVGGSLVGATLEGIVILAYLQQTLTGLVSACQRLLPLGQVAAQRLLWTLKPTLIEALDRSQHYSLDDISFFTPQIDLGSMTHPTLTTRLFIS